MQARHANNSSADHKHDANNKSRHKLALPTTASKSASVTSQMATEHCSAVSQCVTRLFDWGSVLLAAPVCSIVCKLDTDTPNVLSHTLKTLQATTQLPVVRYHNCVVKTLSGPTSNTQHGKVSPDAAARSIYVNGYQKLQHLCPHVTTAREVTGCLQKRKTQWVNPTSESHSCHTLQALANPAAVASNTEPPCGLSARSSSVS